MTWRRLGYGTQLINYWLLNCSAGSSGKKAVHGYLLLQTRNPSFFGKPYRLSQCHQSLVMPLMGGETDGTGLEEKSQLLGGGQ